MCIDETNGMSEVFTTRVRAKSDRPVLNLEEFEGHLESVECADSGSKITLTFPEGSGSRTVEKMAREYRDGTVITSHEGCNADGERSAYR